MYQNILNIQIFFLFIGLKNFMDIMFMVIIQLGLDKFSYIK
jgi:hypothetical protein